MAAFQVTTCAADLAPGKWGIPEPREGLPEVPPEQMDLVFVPGSAFAEGAAAGAATAAVSTTKSAASNARPARPGWGSAFEAQLVPAIECEAHDLPVTAIVTERTVSRPGLSESLRPGRRDSGEVRLSRCAAPTWTSSRTAAEPRRRCPGVPRGSATAGNGHGDGGRSSPSMSVTATPTPQMPVCAPRGS